MPCVKFACLYLSVVCDTWQDCGDANGSFGIRNEGECRAKGCLWLGQADGIRCQKRHDQVMHETVRSCAADTEEIDMKVWA